MKKIIISGPDGVGKTSILDEVKQNLIGRDFSVGYFWMRFCHLLSKFVNAIGRILGKSYQEKYSWGVVGYHDYKGLLGYAYIITNFFDYVIFLIFLQFRLWRKKEDILLIDRCLLDLMIDLIIETGHRRIVLALFSPLLRFMLRGASLYILRCDVETVYSRRKDVQDDKNYEEKHLLYQELATFFHVPSIDTSKLSIEESSREIIKNSL